MMNEQVTADTDTRKPYFISISEAETMTGIPNATLKRYVLNHPQFITYKKEGREYRILLSDMEKLKRIRQLYNDGLKKDGVNERLEADGLPVTLTSYSEEGADLVSMNEEMEEMKCLLRVQTEYIQRVDQRFEGLMQGLQQLSKENAELKHLLNRKESEEVASLRQSLLEDKQGQAKERAKEQTELLAKIEETAKKATAEQWEQLKLEQQEREAQEEQQPKKKGWLGWFLK